MSLVLAAFATCPLPARRSMQTMPAVAVVVSLVLIGAVEGQQQVRHTALWALVSVCLPCGGA